LLDTELYDFRNFETDGEEDPAGTRQHRKELDAIFDHSEPNFVPILIQAAGLEERTDPSRTNSFNSLGLNIESSTATLCFTVFRYVTMLPLAFEKLTVLNGSFTTVDIADSPNR
jgi:hypothetical protein